MTLYGKLSDKLDVRVSICVFCDIFKVNIYTIKLIVKCSRHNLIDQCSSRGCMCEHICCIYISIFKVTEQSPYLNTLGMAVADIILACYICQIAVVVI